MVAFTLIEEINLITRISQNFQGHSFSETSCFWTQFFVLSIRKIGLIGALSLITGIDNWCEYE